MKTINEQIKDFLNGLNSPVEIIDYIDIDQIDENDPFNSIYYMIEENGGFDIEIIYYDDAINYLKENDPSLLESLEIASDLGYKVNDLNSEILASLLASKIARDKFLELKNKINNFFKHTAKKRTYNIVFNDEENSNDKGFEMDYYYCLNYIKSNNGTNNSYFADYKGGTVSIVCNETGETVYETSVF